jgi:hypothetical protein
VDTGCPPFGALEQPQMWQLGPRFVYYKSTQKSDEPQLLTHRKCQLLGVIQNSALSQLDYRFHPMTFLI